MSDAFDKDGDFANCPDANALSRDRQYSNRLGKFTNLVRDLRDALLKLIRVPRAH